MAKKEVEKKFTMAEAIAYQKKVEAEQQADRRTRILEFERLINEAMEKTGCILQVDMTSSLNELRIIPMSKT